MEVEHLTEYKDFLRLTKGLSDKSIADYTYWIKKFDPNLMSQDYINDYIQSRGNNQPLRASVYKLLEMCGLLKIYDMPPKITGRQRKRIIRGIAKEEIQRVSNYLYNKSFKKGLIFDIAYQGALRRVEVTTIKLKSFKWLEWLSDITKPCQLIVLGKNDKERVVLINSETAEKIFNYYNDKYNFDTMDQIQAFMNSPALLFSYEGHALSKWFIWKLVHSASIEVLGRDIRTHELRHARATELERMGVPIRDIKIYLGHSSLATTEIYLHRDETEAIVNIQKIISENK